MRRRKKKAMPRPAYPGVYIEEVPSGPRTIAGVTTSIAAFVGYFSGGPVCKAKRVTDLGGFREVFGGQEADLETGYVVEQFFENGGKTAWIVRAAGEDAAPDELVTALSALDDVETFNILCIPDTVRLKHEEAATLAAAATAYCEKRRAFYILDVAQPAERPINTVETMRSWIETNAALRHRNAAVYFPRPVVAGRTGARPIAASGTVAGLYARTVVWKPAAGTEARLQGLQSLESDLTDDENGVLSRLGVNCLRRFPGEGCVCWGARTLVGADDLASEWKYIPVRRLALFIEESLYRGTQWVVFEPNDEPLWAQIRLAVGAFMQELFHQGAFKGRSPSEAYLVKCDAETTAPHDINLGIVNILVGFAAVKPAEFVIINIQQRVQRA